MNREQALETFRQAILAALDTASREVFNPGRNDAGATDADLPRLFKAIDAQVDCLAARYGVTLIDAEPPRVTPEEYAALVARERAQKSR